VEAGEPRPGAEAAEAAKTIVKTELRLEEEEEPVEEAAEKAERPRGPRGRPLGRVPSMMI
jgi:hypothetical protein